MKLFPTNQNGFAYLAILIVSLIFIIGFTGYALYQKPANNKPRISTSENYLQKALQSIDCPKPRDPKMLPDTYYKGSMIDTHIHIDSLIDPQFEGQSIAEWICMMDVEGTDKVFAFFPVWEPIIQESLNLVRAAMDKYPGRFIPFIGTPDRDGSPEGHVTVGADELADMHPSRSF